MDFDPRDDDSRDDDRLSARDVYEARHRDDAARSLGRGPGNARDSDSHDREHDPRDDARWPDREREARGRAFDARDTFARDLDLPRGPDRERVRDRGHEYTLRGSETRTLATVGAFRVVSSRDLLDHDDGPADSRSGDLRHLRADYDGQPDRTDEKIRDWALEHDLPYFDEEVHFPDLRIEYRDHDGREHHEDVEVTTEHYRGAHAASVVRSGFSCYGGLSLRIGGRGGSRGGSGGPRGGLAGEMLE